MEMGILIATVTIGGVGLFVGLFLAFAGKVFFVPVDEKEIAVREVLPGANCGSCGFPGCDGLAASIAKGEAAVSACPVGGAEVAAKIGEIMGVAAGETQRMVAFVRCTGSCEDTTEKYIYSGPKSCTTLGLVPASGPKSCTFGCAGFGDCVNVCEFDAIHIVKGVAVVDESACKDCKKCIEICPKGLIVEIPADRKARVACANPAKGKAVISACAKGCIACKKCAKACPVEAIDVDEKGYAVLDYEKCINCGKCKKECPRNCII